MQSRKLRKILHARSLVPGDDRKAKSTEERSSDPNPSDVMVSMRIRGVVVDRVPTLET